MTPRFIAVVVALLTLIMSAVAHAAPANYFKGTIARRSANDPKIVSNKTLDVKFKNTKMKAAKLLMANGLKNKAYPHANTIREIKVIKINAAELRAKKGGN